MEWVIYDNLQHTAIRSVHCLVVYLAAIHWTYTTATQSMVEDQEVEITVSQAHMQQSSRDLFSS